MSNFQEDPKRGSSKTIRKEKSALRVGDNTQNGKHGQQGNSQRNNSGVPVPHSRSNIPVPPEPPKKYSNPPPNFTPAQVQNLFSARSSLSFLTTEGMLREKGEGQNNMILANAPQGITTNIPIVPRDTQEGQPQRPVAPLPPLQIQPTRTNTAQSKDGWRVPVESSFFNGSSVQEMAYSNFTAFFKGETAEPELGMPRKASQKSQKASSRVPTNLPLIPTANPPYYKEKTLQGNEIQRTEVTTQNPMKDAEINRNQAGNTQNVQVSLNAFQNSPPLAENKTSSHSSAQAVLLQFIRNQTLAFGTFLARGGTIAPTPLPFFAPPRSYNSIPSSQARFLQNLQVSLQPFNPSRVIKTENQSQLQEGREQSPAQPTINPTVNHFLLLHYLITEEANKHKTTNIHLVLDRLQASLNRHSPILTQQWTIPSQTKVKYLKEYFPYLASIKHWHQDIKAKIAHSQNMAINLRQRNTSIAESKLLMLKSCGAKAKQTLDLLNSTIRTLTVVSEQTKVAGEMMTAHYMNNKNFTYLHPSDCLLLIGEKMRKDYQSMQEKAAEILLFTPMHYSPMQEVESVGGIQVLCELVQKLAEESGNLYRLQARVKKMKHGLPDRSGHPTTQNQQSSLQKAKQHWKMIDFFREITSILRRRAANNAFFDR